jgi:hypothetical protein
MKKILLIVYRWIKYEQRIDLETNILSKPFVGPILYQSLLYLKTGLQYGKLFIWYSVPIGPKKYMNGKTLSNRIVPQQTVYRSKKYRTI